jgi:hypothetical protein
MTTVFKYGLDEYELDYTVETPDFSYPIIVLRNPLNGEMSFKGIQYYDTFVVRCHLWNYEDDAEDKFTDIYALRGKKVYFKPHLDTDYIKNSNGDYVYFWITDVTPYKLALATYDYFIVRLVSSTFINSTISTLYVDENGEVYIIDDKGGFIHE